MLGKGNPIDEYHGDFSEKSILIHALNRLKKTSPDSIIRIFGNVNDTESRHAIEAYLSECDLFEDVTKETDIWKCFKLSSKGLKLSFKDGIESAVDSFLRNQKNQDLNSEMEAQKAAIKKYKYDVFLEFQKYGIGDEVAWENIAKKANVPESHWDVLKNILYHEWYMYKTISAQGMGDLVRGQPSIIAALYELEESPSASVIYNVDNRKTISAGGNVVGSGNDHSTFVKSFNNESTTETTTNINTASSQKSNWQKISEFVISNIWKILVALLTAFIIYKFGWN